MLWIPVSFRITGSLGLRISGLGISVLRKSALSRVAVIVRSTGRRLSDRHLRRLVISHRLVSLHLGIGAGLGIPLRIGILLLVLVSLLILISLLCGISRISGSAGIASLRITVLLRIPCLIRVLIFLSHIFSFPLGR